MKDEIKFLRLGAWLQLIAVVIGGPLLVMVVDTIAPQPVWSGIDTFTSHYSFLQSLPYWAGFVLIVGNVLFVVSAGCFESVRNTIRYPLALIAVAVYASMIAFNYTIQVAYIPAAVRTHTAGIEIFSMANAGSMSWALEMFGYAILGIALWLVAPAFIGNVRRTIIRRLLIADAVASIFGAVIAVIFSGGMLDEGALVGYYSWNALVACIAILVLVEYRLGVKT